MKSTLTKIALILLLFSSVKCTDIEVTPRDYPRVRTTPVTEFTSNGVKLNAVFTEKGNHQLLAYGFVYGEGITPTLANDKQVIMSEELKGDTYAAIIDHSLKKGATYYVRAFAKTEKYTIYGENMTFESLGSKVP